jgi:hypothetical protein
MMLDSRQTFSTVFSPSALRSISITCSIKWARPNAPKTCKALQKTALFLFFSRFFMKKKLLSLLTNFSA